MSGEKEPFCFNEICHYHQAEVSADCKGIDIDIPIEGSIIVTDVLGHSRTVEVARHTMRHPSGAILGKYCDACKNMVQKHSPLKSTYN